MGLSRKKRNIVSSRLKAFVFFQDSFNNYFKGGWKFRRGQWVAGSSTASTAYSSSLYPMASVPMKDPNVTISIKNPGIGSGAALWVTDEGNWYGLVSSQVASPGTGACLSVNPYNPCGATNGCEGTGGNCYGSGGCSGTGGNCVATGGNYAGTQDQCVVANPQCNVEFGNCNTQGGYCNQGGFNCNTGGGNCRAATGGNCNTGGGNCRSATGGNCAQYGWCGIPTAVNYWCCNRYNPYNPCPSRNPYNPCVSVNPYNPCPSVNPYNPCVNINPYNYCININPYNPCVNVNPYNPCVNVNPYNPCAYTTSVDYYNPVNPCGSANPYNPCGSVNPYNPCAGVNPYNPCGAGGNCAGTGGSCSSYATTYPRYLQLIKFTSNVATAIYTFTLDAVTSYVQMKGLKIQISNATKGGTTATITAKAYSDTAMVTQIGSDLIYNATGVNIVANYGIVVSPSSYNQESSLGEITIS
jgi:hypothetical protein